jgi:RNA-directed DNA polymerase
MDVLERVPPWLLRPLPANAAVDAELIARVDALAAKLPASIADLDFALYRVKPYHEYDAAANRAAAHVWLALPQFYAADQPELRRRLVAYAGAHLPEPARARVLRRLVRDTSIAVRRRAQKMVRQCDIREVALPADPDGAWDASGWFRGTEENRLARHRQGTRVLERLGLPVLRTLRDVREALGVKSEKQLGYFLLATDQLNGPYTRFQIPKRDGRDREICAPKPQLRWTQRQILDQILARVPAHDAAHGFVPGRSTVTNAEPHRGAKLLIKFDLTDFFPTIHYFRVVGLFASLGYSARSPRFAADDQSDHVAATLARLCCYTRAPRVFGTAVVPQGAPTSPALSNLVCRRLDARLAGLARRNGGVYTRYADDLTFSFKDDGLDLGRFRWWVDQVCHQEGFFVNQHKFRVIRASQRQVVTGIVVNDVLRVPREERRRFRAILTNCRRHGVTSQARGRTGFADYLRGFASYLYMVHPDEGTELRRQVNELLGPDEEPAP